MINTHPLFDFTDFQVVAILVGVGGVTVMGRMTFTKPAKNRLPPTNANARKATIGGSNWRRNGGGRRCVVVVFVGRICVSFLCVVFCVSYFVCRIFVFLGGTN